MQDDVRFRGTKNGVLLVLNDQTAYPVLKERLAERLAEAEGFFYPGAGVTLDVGSRVLTTQQLLELEQLLEQPHGLKLVNVMHESPAAPAPRAPVRAATVAAARRTAPADPPAAGDGETILVKRTLRSGQHIRHNGNVVILGEVNPGAEVVAAGDIVVMGALRGIAHAGASGREDAVVVAFRLQPTQLRIAGCIARSPEGAKPPDQPELARVKDGAIVIEAEPHRFFQTAHTQGGL